MAKTICIFSDGTGQAGGDNPIHWTNVYRLYKFTRDIAPGQIAFYDPGLGSDPDVAENGGWSGWLLKLYAQSTGFGITRNIVDCYAALLLSYEPGDRIFLFGFSRGAYTVRSLGGALGCCGIPADSRGGQPPVTRWDQFRARLDSVRPLAVEAVENVYQIRSDADRAAASAAFRARHNSHPALPHFIGVWDTVRALGVKGLSDLLDPFKHRFHDAALNKAVPYGRQALAIDENRETFKPELWDERKAPSTQSIRQVWFAGAHTDIGGGYQDKPKLADMPLQWMIGEAQAIDHPLIVDPAMDPPLAPDALAMQHDELKTGRIPWFRKDRRDFIASPMQAPPAEFHPSVDERFAAPDVLHLDERKPYRPEALRQHPRYRHWY
ncbi:MAG: DUF2235 domain-containing protein [Beijerinckiaceae bacterium]